MSATGDPALGAWALQQAQREGLRPNEMAAALFRPLVEEYGRGALAVDRAVEGVRNCARLRAARLASLAAALH